MELNIETFSPKKAELSLKVETYKNLTIKDVNDNQGYLAVDDARKDLKRTRVEIQKTGKNLRAEAVSFQKKVIALENEYVGMIEPLELELKSKQETIDLQKEIIKRRELLPERKEKLKTIEIEMGDEFILLMDNDKFQEFFNQKKEEFLLEKERKIQEEREKIENEKRIAEAKEQARKEAEERAKKEMELAILKAEEDKRQAIENEKKKAEEAQRLAGEEKARIIAEQKAKEQARIDEENRKKAEAEMIEKEKIAEQKKLEAKKKYQKFLTDNGYTEKNKDDFFMKNTGNEVILYKKIAEFKLN